MQTKNETEKLKKTLDLTIGINIPFVLILGLIQSLNCIFSEDNCTPGTGPFCLWLVFNVWIFLEFHEKGKDNKSESNMIHEVSTHARNFTLGHFWYQGSANAYRDIINGGSTIYDNFMNQN